MGLFREIIETAPVANSLQFGHNFNIVLKNFEKGDRLHEGMPTTKNSFLLFAEVDPTSRVVKAATEVFFWDITPNKYALSNFIDQYNSFLNIVEAYEGETEAFTDELDKKINVDNLEKLLSKKDTAKATQKALIDVFYEHIKDKLGVNGPLLKCKLAVNDRGWFQPGTESKWILAMDSTEKLVEISRKDRQNKNKAAVYSAKKTGKKVKPDDTNKKRALLDSVGI